MNANILFVSTYGNSIDLAWTCKREGANVRMWIQSKLDRDVGDGFVEKTDDWRAHLDWADTIVFDDVGWGAECEKLRAAGKAVVGGSVYADRLEFDREFGQAEMQAAGLTVLPNWDFEGPDAFERAIAFVKEHPDRYVVKPNGKAQNEKVLSFVGQEDDGRDVAETLAFFKRGWGAKIQGFQVQKFAAGVEVAVGAFFNGKDFVLPALVNFEHKKLFPGDIGPSTGEMGTTSFWTGEIALVRETVLRFRERLAASGFVGYFDLNCIASHRGIVPLEATCRFGYPTINLQIDGVLSKWSELLPALARGQACHLRTKRGFQTAVVVAVPPYPFEDPAAFKKYCEDAAVIFKRPLTEGLHPCDVKLVDGDWRLAGSSGYALVVTGSASTMLDARKEAYGRVKQIVIPNMFYRTDIGERWMRDGDLLQSWGFLS
ncbi:MAG: phosphoribosylamine--glycine ligase [Planctomycetota bacterium]|nr:phosphoribosylamine--glycine ligase [Planctomycetota bacterium]